MSNFQIILLKAPAKFKEICETIEYFGVSLSVPKGYPNIATDRDGSVRAYQNTPFVNDGFGVWLNKESSNSIRLAHVDYKGDWIQSLSCTMCDRQVENEHVDLINDSLLLRHKLLNVVTKIDTLNAQLIAKEISTDLYTEQLKNLKF